MAFDIKVTQDTKELIKLQKSLNTITKRHIRFGWIDKKTYPAATGNLGINIAEIARIQEYGRPRTALSPAIPSRPYFRQALKEVQFGYVGEMASVFRTVLSNVNATPELEKVSKELVRDYVQSVSKQNYQKLSDVTISLKKHSYQMIDSGTMTLNYKARVYRENQKAIKD